MKKRILIVDDEADFRELITFVLEAEGYEVITAANGLEALKQAQCLLPNLILLDLMMPELDGISVCEILKRHSATLNIPIIMLTAWVSETAQSIGLQAGAKYYLTKPFSPHDLVLKVNSILLSGQEADQEMAEA